MNVSSTNPDSLPLFSDIRPEEIEPALKNRIAQNRTRLNELLTQSTFTWNNLMAPLEEMEFRSSSWVRGDFLNKQKLLI